MLTRTVLSLDAGVQCLVKWLLNRFALPKKSVTSLLSTSSGGINGILLSFTNVFKIMQHVLGAAFLSLTLFLRHSWHFNLEEHVIFETSSVRAFKDV